MVISTTPLYYITTVPYNHITMLQIYYFGNIIKPIGLFLFPIINIFYQLCPRLMEHIHFRD